ncbi:hypothetical protein BGX28_005820 [Mortierella sp. GBA30]|nr:hypothetical protein BGX28_005820 [Mortierella sp. GBA30]
MDRDSATEAEGCYCLQAQKCPHWIVASRQLQYMDSNAVLIGRRGHGPDPEEDHRPLVNELQRQLRLAMLEIENINKTSRDLAQVNQELEESRLLAVSDQARTAKRLVLMSSQLEFTEQKLFGLTQEVGDGIKDSDLLRIERIKREALQEREDAGRLRIEALQDELQELQRSERLLQQKLLTAQNKYETLAKRHDVLRRQQQEVDLARESKEAIAWLKETTDRLCSPPQGSLGQVIQQEKTSQGMMAPVSIQQFSPSSSPPSSMIADPPLAAQNQFISLIKELATANSTLRAELAEYRDLLQDSRNEIISLRSQVEDCEQGHPCECCGGNSFEDAAGDLRIASGAWSAFDAHDIGVQRKDHHLQSTASPPPYMTTPAGPPTEQHLHHHFHLPGVRGNVFDELEQRLYHQSSQHDAVSSSKHHRHRHSSKKEHSGRRTSRDHVRSSHSRNVHSNILAEHRSTTTATVSTSTSTSEVRRGLTPISLTSGPYTHHHQTMRGNQSSRSESDPFVARNRNKKSLYTDADMDLLDSGDEQENQRERGMQKKEPEDTAERLSDNGDSGSDQEPGFVAAFAEALSFLSFFSGPLSGSPP